MKKLTKKQIQNMIRILNDAAKSPSTANVDTLVLGASTYWFPEKKKNYTDIEDGKYLCEWLKKLVGVNQGFDFSCRLDLWLVYENHAESTFAVKSDMKKYKATQTAMFLWMAQELEKEL